MRTSRYLLTAAKSSFRRPARPLDPPIIKPYNKEYRRTDIFQQQGRTLFDMMSGEDQYKIPEKLRLEVLSPKLRSFPHSKYYFQNLYWIGQNALDTICTTYVQDTTTTKGSCTLTNDFLDFSNAIYHSASLSSEEALNDYSISNRIDTGLNMPPEELTTEKRAQLSREALILLIGAVYIYQGPSAASSLVIDKILEGRSGLLNQRKFS